jgi:excisionase family DNA binding protein
MPRAILTRADKFCRYITIEGQDGDVRSPHRIAPSSPRRLIVNSESTATVTPVCAGLDQAAQYLSLSRKYVEKLVATGRLPSYKIGRRVLVKYDDLNALLQPASA